MLYTDMIARIRNAQMAGHKSVSMRSSRLLEGIAKCLFNEGYIKEYFVEDKILTIKLKEYKSRPCIEDIYPISKSSKKVYHGVGKLEKFPRNRVTYIMSTNKGIMSHREALKENVGGEVLLYVY